MLVLQHEGQPRGAMTHFCSFATRPAPFHPLRAELDFTSADNIFIHRRSSRGVPRTKNQETYPFNACICISYNCARTQDCSWEIRNLISLSQNSALHKCPCSLSLSRFFLMALLYGVNRAIFVPARLK